MRESSPKRAEQISLHRDTHQETSENHHALRHRITDLTQNYRLDTVTQKYHEDL